MVKIEISAGNLADEIKADRVQCKALKIN